MLMKQKKMLVLTFSQLKQIYTQEMPELVEMAAVSPTVEDFKAGLLKHLDSCGMVNEVAEEAREQIRLLLQYDGQDVHELSTGQDISVQTIRLLYQFLTEKLENIEMPTDCSSCSNVCRGKMFLRRLRSASRAGMTGGIPDWMRKCGRCGMRIRNGCCIC